MSQRVLQPASSLDPFLRQVAPLLQTYCNAMYQMTNTRLQVIDTPPQLKWSWRLQVLFENGIPVMCWEAVSHQVYSTSKGLVRNTVEALSLIEIVSLYNLRLKNVVFQQIMANKALQDQGKSLTRKLSKLQKLKESIEEFSTIIDRILSIYTSHSTELTAKVAPSIEDLKKVKEKICRMKNQLKVNELHTLFASYNFTTTHAHILCHILGLKQEFGDWLSGLDVSIKMHRTELQLLEKYLKDKECQLKEEGALDKLDKESLIGHLQNIGFTDERSITMSNMLPPDLIALQYPSFWATKYIQNMFDNHPLLSDFNRYPYSEANTNNWFEANIGTDNRIEPDGVGSSYPVKMLNVLDKKMTTEISTFLKEQENENYKLFYHGTTHTSAKSIIEEGITLSKGSEGQDFSSGDGFYLSENFENARGWCRGSGANNHQAVIVFKVEKELLNSAEYGLDLCDDREKWQKIIFLCRNNYSNKKEKKNLLKDVTFIRGPMCTNPTTNNPKQYKGFGRTDDIQLCIRDEDFAEKFGSIRNICCVLFY